MDSMIRNLFLPIVIILLVIPAGFVAGQSAGSTVTGNIIDGDSNEPLEFATVSLLTKNDSSLIGGNVTGPSGKFTIENVSPGEYLLKIQFISYQVQFRELSVSSGERVKNVGAIELFIDVAELAEVVVEGQRTTMEMKLDKRIFNIGEDLVNRGTDAASVLDNLPSVTVDPEGAVSLRGSQSVKILINGKPSGLVGMDGSSALKQLDANMIETVEIITNPSARYEAEGMAGIINIILKKEQRQGINGTISVNTGYPHDHGASLNLNYRRDWFNIFGSYGINYDRRPREGSSYQEFYNEDGNIDYITDIDRESDNDDLSNTFRLGGDIYINDKNMITASGIYRISDERNREDLFYYDRLESGQLLSRTSRFNDELEDEKVLEYNLNYTRTFSKPEHKFTFDVQYEDNQETEDSDLWELEFRENVAQDSVFERYLNREKENELLLQADYIHPFGENNRFEVGWRSTFRTIDNSYLVEEQNEAGVWVPIERLIGDSLVSYDNDFIYNENIHAFYVVYGREFNRLSAQAGLRGEYTVVETVLEQGNRRNNNEYFKLFPSVHLTYSLGMENSIQASYSRRFRRPGFWHLNPFHTYSDSRNFRSGNPALQPEFTNSFEVGYLKNWTNGSAYAGVYYRHTTDEIDRISYVQDGITFSRPENISMENAYGVEVNMSRELADWFNLDGNLNFYRTMSEGFAYGMDLSTETISMSGRMNAQLELFDGYNLQVSGFYRAPRNTTQGSRKAMYSADVGVSRDVLNGKGTLVMNVRNVFNSLKWRSETIHEINDQIEFYSRSDNQWRPRQFSLSFTYRINRTKQQDRQRQGGGGSGGDLEDNGGGGDF